MKKYILGLCLLLLCMQGEAEAQTHASFNDWLVTARQQARQAGISQPTIDTTLVSTLTPLPRVIELDRKQPEGSMTFAQYREKIVNQIRIDKGREMMRLYANDLARVEERFGVQPQYVVALWGIETNYGANTGGFNVINSLATLAWDGRRSAFFMDELIKALKIIDQGHVTATGMRGSWAGALGQNQFMPSSFHNFAVDGDGDGHKDIWTNKKDVFASTANYLSRSGWKGDEKWGRPVQLPPGFLPALIGLETRKSLAEWSALGVTLQGGGALPAVPGLTASIVAPDGAAGPAFLAYDNFRTIMKWNKSSYFATSVGLLADALSVR